MNGEGVNDFVLTSGLPEESPAFDCIATSNHTTCGCFMSWQSVSSD